MGQCVQYADVQEFLTKATGVLARGPVALIMAEDMVEVDTTIRHHLNAGFRSIVLFAPAHLTLPADVVDAVHHVTFDVHGDSALVDAVNALMDTAEGTWLYYCYNAEYLFHPFCETRNIRELIAHHTEERRDALLSYVVDLYADDLDRFQNAVSLESALLDRSGYYALGRPDVANKNHPKERQLDFYGGLRWRFEEHIPQPKRKIDRVSIFRAKRGLRLRPDFTFTDEEYNTYACPWHHNLTVAVCSFRTAKALRTNPGSRFDIHTFRWRNSTEFQWHSQQLMDLGLMEPGQWF
jgi:hypothetical protein